MPHVLGRILGPIHASTKTIKTQLKTISQIQKQQENTNKAILKNYQDFT